MILLSLEELSIFVVGEVHQHFADEVILAELGVVPYCVVKIEASHNVKQTLLGMPLNRFHYCV